MAWAHGLPKGRFVNFETLARIKRIELAVEAMQKAIDTLQAELTDLKAKVPDRPILTLRKNQSVR